MPCEGNGKFRRGSNLQIHMLDHRICGVLNGDRPNCYRAILLHGIVNDGQHRHIHTDRIITDTIRFLCGQRQFFCCLVCLFHTVILGHIGCCCANLFHRSHQCIDLLLLRLQQLYEICILGSVLRCPVFRCIELPVSIDFHKPATKIKDKMKERTGPFIRVKTHMYRIVSCLSERIKHIVDPLGQEISIF